MKFRKKPVEVEAIQWDGSLDSIRYICEWANSEAMHIGDEDPLVDYVTLKGEIKDVLVHTLEGEMKVIPNDWIIRGVKGEYYPCKPDIFEATYEPVEPPEDKA